MKSSKILLKAMFIILVSLFFMTACEIGLGESVDLEGPTVVLVSPDSAAIVQQNFTVRGSVSDNESVKALEVSISSGNSVVLMYKWEGSWMVFQNGAWQPYPEATFSGTAKSFEWVLPIKISGDYYTGAYTLTTSARDPSGNQSKNSKDSRQITIDGCGPSASVTVEKALFGAGEFNAARDVYNLDSVPGGKLLCNNEILERLVSNDFSVMVNQKENTRLGKFVLAIDEMTDVDDVSFQALPSPEEVPDINSWEHAYLWSADFSLRNFEIKVKKYDLPEHLRSGKHILRIITESYDMGGNKERKLQGFFIYYDESNRPWMEMSLGDDEKIDSSGQKAVYPSCLLQGYAYDNDGLESVDVKLYVLINNVYVLDEGRSKHFDLSNEDNSKNYIWSLYAISDAKHFKIVSSCRDREGNLSEPLVKYFRVSNVNPPKLVIDSPAGGSIVIGDAQSRFNIKGSVETAGLAQSLKIVRIANKNKNDYHNYMDTGNAAWNGDSDGNRIWNIPLPSGVEPVGGYRKYDFDFEFDIKKILGKSLGTGTKIEESGADQKEVSIIEDFSTENIKNHIFIFRIQDDVGAVCEEYTLQGDVEKPELTIEKVHVLHNDNSETVLDLASGKNKLEAYWRDNVNIITDKIYYTGKWKDNLVEQWNDIKSIGKLYLYNITGVIDEIELSDKNTWKSDYFVPEDSTTVNVQAILSDFGGNVSKASASYFVSSCPPTLVRINSGKPDGTYSAGQEISIIMEYNKKVTFEGGTGNPELILSNGGKAEYAGGNGESKHYYKYTVGSNQGTGGKKLYVEKIDLKSNKWVDYDGAYINDPDKLSTGYNLNAVRSIYIDNDNPRIVKVIPVTGSGHYKEGKELFFQAEFDKSVTVGSLADLKIYVNISSLDENGNVVTKEKSISAVSKSSSETALFKYTVEDNDNTVEAEDGKNPAKLKFIRFEAGNNNVRDKAGNCLENNILKDTTDYIEKSGIYIDTKKPAMPSVVGLIKNKVYYKDISGISFSGFEPESEADRYYSFDGGMSWTLYAGINPSISQNGNYLVCAKQVDKAGNESPVSETFSVSLDKGNLLTAVSAVQPDGTYKNGDTLNFILTFRKKVAASGVKLLLKDASPAKKSKYAALKETKDYKTTLQFDYTVEEDDFCNKLDIEGIAYEDENCWIKDENGTVVAGKNETGNVEYSKITPLTSVRNIKLVNGKPVVSDIKIVKPAGAALKERELRITFNSEISKQSKGLDGQNLYITLKQKEGTFEAPAILTKSQYEEYPVAITKFYKETTNGWNVDGNSPDLSSKYVLAYNHETNDSDLVKALEGIYEESSHNVSPDTVPVPMGSNYVMVDESDRKVLVVSLKDDYTLPVQGAVYEVMIPAGIVENNIRERSVGSEKVEKTNPGVETPVIRVDKKNESISAGGKVTQYPKSYYKVDCQTPGAKISIRSKTSEPDCLRLSNNGGDNVVMKRKGVNVSVDPGFGIKPSDLTGTAETVEKRKVRAIGTEINVNTIEENKGYKILIEAKAFTGANAKSYSAAAYEGAMRTIIIYMENGGNKVSDNDYKANRWIRGGDNISGGISTPDFPLSFDDNDYDGTPRHVRAMSSCNNADNVWYWVTWSISKTAYPHFLAGDMPSDAEEKGPKKWWWSSCGWTGMKSQTPAYPGECSVFDTGANGRYGGHQFLAGGTDGEKHRNSR